METFLYILNLPNTVPPLPPTPGSIYNRYLLYSPTQTSYVVYFQTVPCCVYLICDGFFMKVPNRGGGGEVRSMYTSCECVYCVVSAEYAECAYGTVLAWGRKSYFGALYRKRKTVLLFKYASLVLRS
jgi:hypothetical protein